MADKSLSSFISPSWHVAISDIIKRRSTNQRDVRESTLDNLDLSFAHKVLDLGCGFGFMSEAVARRVAPQAHVVGVDTCFTNERPFLERVTKTGRTGEFICRRIDQQLDWPDDSFDLIITSYALYFFPDVLPEIARILAPHGLFLALTHTEKSCQDLLRAVNLSESDSPLMPIIRGFSADNGQHRLSQWFGEVERIDYSNSLVFGADQPDELLTYLRFKLPFLLPDGEPGRDLPEPLTEAVRDLLAEQARVVLDKNDAAFRCRMPKCR